MRRKHRTAEVYVVCPRDTKSVFDLGDFEKDYTPYYSLDEALDAKYDQIKEAEDVVRTAKAKHRYYSELANEDIELWWYEQKVEQAERLLRSCKQKVIKKLTILEQIVDE